MLIIEMNAINLNTRKVLAFRVGTDFPIRRPEISSCRYDERMGDHGGDNWE